MIFLEREANPSLWGYAVGKYQELRKSRTIKLRISHVQYKKKMYLWSMLNPLKNIVVIGDRVLIKPLEAANKTSSGLYLPPSVKEHDSVHTGLVVKVGPGYPIPANQDPDAAFRGETGESVNYVPLQVKEGDEALYLHANSTELEVGGERYVIISQNAVLLVVRPEVPDDVSSIDSL